MNDQALIQQIVEETNAYLDAPYYERFLGHQVEAHLATARLAERLGQEQVVSRHIAAATKMLTELFEESAGRMIQTQELCLGTPAASLLEMAGSM